MPEQDKHDFGVFINNYFTLSSTISIVYFEMVNIGYNTMRYCIRDF